NADAFCYYIHTSCFLVPVSVISFIQHSDSHVSTFFSTADSEFSKFSYPDDPSDLLEMLCEYVRKIFTAFDFLSTRCKNYANCGGWMECYFGKSCQTENSASGSFTSNSDCKCENSDKYLCTASNPSVHDHCAQGECLNSGSSKTCDNSNGSVHKSKPGQKCSKKCPHPLQRFLCDGSSDSSVSKSLFVHSDITPMGFSPDKLSSTGRNGSSLHAVLKVFCDDGFYPLTRLVQFALCIFRNPPETLGELFAFFFRFGYSDVFTSNFESWINGEPGFYSGSDLKKAIQNLYGSSHSGNSHSNDLKSLYDCSSTKGSSGTPPTCGKYLYPLTYNAYNNKNFIEGFLDTYLSWVCYSAEKFEKKLKEFHHEASTKSLKCCLSSSCKIVECPCALPFLY
ncbi:variant erythrocyte surface antigen-1 family protein, partial [Babesia divergens]